MARKRRGAAAAAAAAARAARARATRSRQSSQRQQEEDSIEEPASVPEDDTIDDTSVTEETAEAPDDSEKTEAEETPDVAEPPPPEDVEDSTTENPESITTPPPESNDETVDSQPPTPPESPPPEKPDPSDKSLPPQDQDTPEKSPATDAPDTEESGETGADVKPKTETSPPEGVNGTEAPSSKVEDERDYYVNALKTDKHYLVDTSLGFIPVENLKEPLTCFTTEDELQLFPVIESMSAKLYTIVQRMTLCQKREVEAAAKSIKGVIKIKVAARPGKVLGNLCWVNFMDPPAEKTEKSPSKRAPHPFLLTEDENMFSEDKLKMLRAVLDAGWKREVVMRSPGSTGRKTGDVYYYNPQGTKFRSSKQVEKHLSELRDTPFTIENFTFAKVRISTNPEQEIVRKAYDGKSPPRAPPKPTSSKGKVTPPSRGESSKSVVRASTSSSKAYLEDTMKIEEPVKGVSSRRSIQPPKRYSSDAVLLLSKRTKIQDDKRKSNSNTGLMQMGMLPPKYPKGMEDSSINLSESMDFNELGGIHDELAGSNSVAMKEIAEDSLFQISALRQSGGIDVDNMHQLVESQKQLAQKAAQAALIQDERKQGNRMVAGSSKRKVTVIPCSIRCPGMEGAVPNLQCVRCLCLFHAECLGLPPNLAFNKYLCSNCTDQQGPSAATAAIPNAANSQQKNVVKKPGEVKRSPPGLAPIPHGNMLRGAMASGRDVTVTLSAKEGQRLPQKVVPQSVGVARGMIRNRGMPPPPPRTSAQMHPGHRMISSDGHGHGMRASHHQVMKRGRGRPPSVAPSRPIPQLSKNLTITHLPRIPGALPVPNLQPMAPPKSIPGKLPLPMMGGTKARQAIPAVPNLMKSNAFRVTVPPPSLSGRTFKKPLPTSHPQNPTNLRLASGQTATNKSAAVVYAPSQEKSVSVGSLLKRYPQSVCTIGNKKFVVLPKRRPAEFSPVRVVGNGGPPHKGNTIEIIRSTETTIKKIVTIGNQINCAENNVVNSEPMDDGTTEVNNTDGDDSTPMEEDGQQEQEQEQEAGIDIRPAANEPIAATQ